MVLSGPVISSIAADEPAAKTSAERYREDDGQAVAISRRHLGQRGPEDLSSNSATNGHSARRPSAGSASSTRADHMRAQVKPFSAAIRQQDGVLPRLPRGRYGLQGNGQAGRRGPRLRIRDDRRQARQVARSRCDFPTKTRCNSRSSARKTASGSPSSSRRRNAGSPKHGANQVVTEGIDRGPGRGRLGGPHHQGRTGIVERGPCRDRPQGRRQDANALRPQRPDRRPQHDREHHSLLRAEADARRSRCATRRRSSRSRTRSRRCGP